MNREEYLNWYNENKTVSGSFAKEKWHTSRNTLSQFKEIYTLTDYLPVTSTFRERIFHLDNDLYSIPKCICGKDLTFTTTNSYSIKCKSCGGKKKRVSNDKSKNTKRAIEYEHDLVKFIQKNLLNKNNKFIPNISNRQLYINSDSIHIYDKIMKVSVDNNISFLLAIDFILHNNRCKSCNTIIHSDREFCSTKCSTSSLSVRDKIKETWIGNLGVDNPFKNENIKETINSRKQEKWLMLVDDKLFKDSHIIPMFEFDGNVNAKTFYQLQCTNCNHIFNSKIWYNMNLRCPECDPYHASIFEREIYEFLIEHIHTDEIILHHRKSFYSEYKMEVDFYLPKYNLAIEYDSFYYHTEFQGGKNNKYHLTKTEMCNKRGIQLLHIFEDEWEMKNDIIKSKILHQLKLHKQSIYARKCNIKEIPASMKNEFLNKNHLQGQDISNINLGLFYNEELVSVMTFSKPRAIMGKKITSNYEFELSRYASQLNLNVVGGAGKLLSYFKTNYQWETIYTYADRRWSIGNLYKSLGMTFEKITRPNYWYVKNKHREYRYKYRKSELNKLFPDCDMSKTEMQIMVDNGYDIIWDCGHYKYSIDNM